MVQRFEESPEVQTASVQHLNSDSISEGVVAGLREALGPTKGSTIPLHEPEFSDIEFSIMQDCLKSGWVSSLGPFVTQFEEALQTVTGARHVIAMASGTAALHLILHAIGVRPGDEVIVPALSFVATANAVSHCHASPHFVDSELITLGLCPIALRRRLAEIATNDNGVLKNRITGAAIKAVVPMHAFGHPCQIEEIISVAREFELPVVEDAAESLGSSVRGRHTGSFGVAGMLSFNGNKVVTTGNGGAVLTNDSSLAVRLRHLSTTAKVSHSWRYQHDEIGWNYRLPNLNAALGCAQLSKLPDILVRKRRLSARYQEVFSRISSTTFTSESRNSLSNYWLNTIQLLTDDIRVRDATLQAAHDAGYLCRPAWDLLSSLPMYTTSPRGPLTNAAKIERSLICLPSGPRLEK